MRRGPLRDWLQNRLKQDDVREHLKKQGYNPDQVMKMDLMSILAIIKLIIQFLEAFQGPKFTSRRPKEPGLEQVLDLQIKALEKTLELMV